MSAQLAQRVFAVGGNQTYLSLKKDEYIRQLPISNNWTKLRIGVLISVEGSATIPGCHFSVGLCTYPYGVFSYNCINHVGAALNALATAPFTYNANAGVPYYGHGSSALWRRGLTQTALGASATETNTAASTGAVKRRSVWVFDFLKGSPNYTVTGWGTTSAGLVVADYTYANMIDAAESGFSAPPYINGVVTVAWSAGAAAGACNENTGIFDAVSIAWNKMEYAMEVYGIAVYRIY